MRARGGSMGARRGPRAADATRSSEGQYPAGRVMDFLLECIGFPPDTDLSGLAAHIRGKGERSALRGPAGEHLRVPISGGLEVRLDREAGQEHDSLWPYYEAPRRLRVAL